MLLYTILKLKLKGVFGVWTRGGQKNLKLVASLARIESNL